MKIHNNFSNLEAHFRGINRFPASSRPNVDKKMYSEGRIKQCTADESPVRGEVIRFEKLQALNQEVRKGFSAFLFLSFFFLTEMSQDTFTLLRLATMEWKFPALLKNGKVDLHSQSRDSSLMWGSSRNIHSSSSHREEEQTPTANFICLWSANVATIRASFQRHLLASLDARISFAARTWWAKASIKKVQPD